MVILDALMHYFFFIVFVFWVSLATSFEKEGGDNSLDSKTLFKLITCVHFGTDPQLD